MAESDDEAPPELIDAQVDETNDHGPGLIRKVPISIITGMATLLGLHISRIRGLWILHSHTTEHMIVAKAEKRHELSLPATHSAYVTHIHTCHTAIIASC